VKYDKIIKKNNKISNELGNLKLECERLKNNNEALGSALNGMMHEVRRFSSELSDYAEKISKLTTGDNGRIKELSDTIYFTSGMLASRLAFTDIELNPSAIRLQNPTRTGIYKKFDKARHILMNRAKSKQIHIILKGKSVKEFDAIEAFELVPFVILDNAVKYSPAGREINVLFKELPRELEVVVSSCGPKVDSDELPNIFKKGVRGRNGALAASAGDGLGLYLAKTLCDLTSTNISATSNQHVDFQLGGIGYSDFEVRLVKKF
jgi:signal transduction histidine kinase